MLPSSLTSRPLNRAPIGGIAMRHPDDRNIEEIRESAQGLANRIEALLDAVTSNSGQHLTVSRPYFP